MTISYSGPVFLLLFRWKGSVWKAVWKEILIFLLFYYSLSLSYRFALNEQQQSTFEAVVITFSHYADKLPISFLLGFYVTTVVQRWWHQFESIPWPEDVLNFVCYIMQNKIYRLKRRTIARYLVLAEALCFRDISLPVRKRFPTVKHLVEANLMTEEELDLYSNTSIQMKWFIPLQWVQTLIQEVPDLPPNVMSNFIKELIQYRHSLRKLYCYDWISVPLVYTQVATLVTYSFVGLCVIGRQYLNPEKSHKGSEVDLYFPIYTILQLLFYVGWFKVAKYLMRPMGEDDDDLELNYLLDRNIQVALATVDEIFDQRPDISVDPLLNSTNAGAVRLPHTVISIGATKAEHPPKQHYSLAVERAQTGESTVNLLLATPNDKKLLKRREF